MTTNNGAAANDSIVAGPNTLTVGASTFVTGGDLSSLDAGVLDDRRAAFSSLLQDGALTVFDEELASLYLQSTGALMASEFASLVSLSAGSFANVDDRAYVVVDIIARNGDGAGLLAAIQAAGVDILHGSAFRGMTGGLVAVDQLAALQSVLSGGLDGAESDVGMARLAHRFSNVGNVTTQADVAQYNNVARATFNVDGTGIRVGVLSDSFSKTSSTTDNQAKNIASGDLPAATFVYQEYTGNDGIDEGRAMAQLVHDLAPGASIDFATAFLGQASFANNIVQLANRGAQIIVDDVFYFAELAFQNGVIAQAVNQVVNSGVTFFSSAGNNGVDGWDGAWSAGASRTFGASTYTTMRFGAGQDYITMTPQSSTAYFVVQWDQPSASAGGAANAIEIDVFLTTAAGAVVQQTTAVNIGGDAVSVLGVSGLAVGTAYRLVVGLKNGSAAPNELRVVALDATPGASTGNLNSSTFYGHAAAEGAIAVSAVSYAQTPAFGVAAPVHESFTTRGPARIWYDDAGVRLGQVDVRQIPITAVDGGNTTFFSSDDGDADTFPNFYGTSAAAPDAAAVAALMLQARGDLTPTDIRNLLQASALDMNDTFTAGFDAGYDSRTGAGLINANLAVGFAQNLVIANASQTLLKGTHLGDTINGSSAADTLRGFDGADSLSGAGGADTLEGGNGADTLTGGAAADSLTGGAGTDTFTGAASDLNGDTIVDLTLGETIVLSQNLAGPGAISFTSGSNKLGIDADNNGSFETQITLANAPTGGFTLSSAGGFTNNVLTFGAAVATPSLAISPANVTQNEGDSGATAFVFTVTRTGDTSGATTANWAVSGSSGNPASAADFGGSFPSGVVSFAAGDTTATLTVNVVGDAVFEPTEGFTVTLSNPSGSAVITTATATGTITNDDQAPSLAISPANVTQSEGDSGPTTFAFTVTRSGDTSGSTTVNWAVSGSSGNPANAADFGGVLPSGVASFAAGQTTATINVNVIGDTAFEPTEGFTVTLSNPSGPATISTATATGTITNDDPQPPTLAISPINVSQNEGNSGSTAFTFTVTRTGDTSGATTANWAVSGSSSNPANVFDFATAEIFPSGTVSFGAGETTATITVYVAGDTTFEASEGFTVTLSNPSGPAVIATASATGTILNDDGAPTLTMSPANITLAEGNSGTTAYVFTVTRTGDTSGASSASWAVTGSSGNPANAADFGGALPSGVVAFAAGQTTATITVNVTGDTAFEPTEGFTVTLSNPSGATVISAASATGTITNDDLDGAPPALVSTAPADEQGNVAVGANLVLTFNEAVQAGSGVLQLYDNTDRGSAPVLVTTILVTDVNQVSFSGSTMTVDPTANLQPGRAYYLTFGSGVVVDLAGNAFAGLSSTQMNFFTAAPDTAAPVLVSSSPADDATGVNPAANLVLTFNEQVQAGTGSFEIWKLDPKFGAVLFRTIAAGDATQVSVSGASVTLNPTVDLDPSSSYYVNFTAGAVRDLAGNNAAALTSQSAYNFSTGLAAPLPTLAIGPANITLAEGNGGTTAYSFTVTRTGDTSGATTANWAVTGSSANPANAADFGGTLPSGVVSFVAGQTTATLTVNVAGDTAFEPTEGFTVTLSGASGSAVIATASATGTITNDDAGPPSLAIGPANLAQNEGNAGTTAFTFTVTRSGDVSGTSSANWAVSGSSGNAANVFDFATAEVFPSGTVTFAAGATTATIVVNVLGDTAFEPTEGFTVTLSSPSAGTTISTASATGTIVNDDTNPSDTTAPLLVSSSPADEQGNIAPQANLVLTFNEAVQAGSGVLQIYDNTDRFAAPVLVRTISVTDAGQVSFSGSTLTINPTADLSPSRAYYLTFGSGVVVDLAGNAFAGLSSTQMNFFTAAPDTAAPVLVSSSPADDATGVNPAANLVLTFNEQVQAGTGSFEIWKLDPKFGAVLFRTIAAGDATQVSVSGASVTLNPTVDLDPSSSYYVNFTAGAVRDLAGNNAAALTSQSAYNFSTGSGVVVVFHESFAAPAFSDDAYSAPLIGTPDDTPPTMDWTGILWG